MRYAANSGDDKLFDGFIDIVRLSSHCDRDGGGGVCERRFVCALMNLLKCFVRKLSLPTSLNRAYYFLINKNNELSFVL